ncbi:MAG: radical SAM protein [Gammaproteobacteria bacterium]|nr:radical SAM protein [Gammaproteobacteria bacterium]
MTDNLQLNLQLRAAPSRVASPSGMAQLPRVDPITQLPVLVLFPHNRCNCRCLMCDIWRIKDKAELGLEAIAHWLQEWRTLGVRHIMLSGGEPLMYSRTWELCALLRKSGIRVTIHSTGVLLEREAKHLISHCDDVILSLDGPQPVHDTIRNIRRAYGRLRDGVSAVRTLAPGFPIAARCTIQRQNFRHMRETVASARELGLDRISFLAADVSSDAFNRLQAWEADKIESVALSAGDLPHLAEELQKLEAECADEFACGFIAEPPAKLWAKLYQYYQALHGGALFPEVRCNAPWVSAVVETDGTVRPCFFQPPFGNLHETTSLAAILNADASLKWRQHLDVSRDPICMKCVCSFQFNELPDKVSTKGESTV